MNTELVCVMASLGYSDGDEYYKGIDCVESLKDMIRFLRHEDNTCNIRRQMGQAQVLRLDLLQLLIHHGEDKHLCDIVLRLLVNLTSPVDICFPKLEESEKENMERQANMIQLLSYLQSYKEAFTDEKVMAAFASHIARILKLDWENRHEEDNLFLERLLLTLRNVLHVPSNPEAEKRTEDDVTLHDQILWSLHLNGIDDLLLFIASSPSEQQWGLHALEIISYMLREQNPENLARADEGRSTEEKQEDTKMLQTLLEREIADKKSKVKKFSSRHSNFGGTFWLPEIKGLNKKDALVYHRPLANAKDMSFDFDKDHTKKNKAKRPLEDKQVERNSILSIRLFLKEFCRKFIEHCYNPLMKFVKDKLTNKKTQENDEIYYLWSIRYFMAFNRTLKFNVELVGETLHMREFEYVLNLLEHYHSEYALKQSKPEWAKRLHVAVQAYKELLTYIFYMEKSKQETWRASARVIQSNIFYIDEYRSIFIKLVTKYNKAKLPRACLRDTIEAFHLFLKMLEKFAGDKELLVEQKKKQRRVKKTKKATTSTLSQENKDQIWESSVASSLSAILQGRDEQVVADDVPSPFDPLSSVPVEEQRETAKAKIQDLLLNDRGRVAVNLLRASREVWPEDKEFGKVDLSPEEEFLCLREIFYKELSAASTGSHSLEEEYENEEENEVEEIRNEIRTEKTFSVKKFIHRLADPDFVEPYAYLLRFYKENAEHTNHCIVKMLHRIAVDLKTPSMLFQLSLFILFKKILFDPAAGYYKELCQFINYILVKFFELVPEKPMIFMELLSWKSSKECYELVEGYGTFQDQSEKKREKWSYEDEEELKALYYQYKEGDDVLEKIMDGITNKQRTERQIISKLVRLKLVPNARAIPRPRKQWNPGEDEELRKAFLMFKESDDPIGNILEASFMQKSRRKITRRLLDLNVITSSKEVRKKRRKNSNKSKENQWISNGKHPHEDDHQADEDSNNEGNGCLPILEEEASDASMLSEDTESSDEGALDEEGDEEVSYPSDLGEDKISQESRFSSMCRHILAKGMKKQLVWLKDRLLSAAKDREEQEEWQNIPLVTLTLEQEMACRKKEFKALLKLVGIREPVTHDEKFWRISHSLPPQKLRNFVKLMESMDQDEQIVMSGEQTSGMKEIGENGLKTTATMESEGNTLEVDDNQDESRIPPEGSNRDVDLKNYYDEDSNRDSTAVGRVRKRTRALIEDDSDDEDLVKPMTTKNRARNTHLSDSEDELEANDNTHSDIDSEDKDNDDVHDSRLEESPQENGMANGMAEGKQSVERSILYETNEAGASAEFEELGESPSLELRLSP